MAIGGLFAASCAPAMAGSLEDEMRDLIANHPQIQAKTKAVKSAEEGIRGARSGYLPSVKFSGDQGHEYINSGDRRETQGKAFLDKRNTAGLTVTQKIFDGFATDSSVAVAQATQSVGEADLRNTRQTTLLEGAAAYLDVIRYTKMVALARESERKISEQENLEDERVKKGSGIASDVLSAKQRLATAKERRVNFEEQFQSAVARYIQVFGHAPDVAALADPPLPADLIPESVDQALDSAEKDNPLLESATESIKLSSGRHDLAEAGYWPTLDLVGKMDYEHGKNASVGVRRDWSLMLVASWELFSGFKTDAAVAQASWDLGASKDTRSYNSRKISENVRTHWSKLQTARQRVDLLENAAVLAEEVWEATKKKREAGKATVTEVLDDENRINDARINYTAAYYDMYMSSYQLVADMGRLEVDNLARAKPATSRDTSPFKADEYTHPMGQAPKPASKVNSAAKAAPVPAAVAAAAPVLAPPAAERAANAAMMERMREVVSTEPPGNTFWTVR